MLVVAGDSTEAVVVSSILASTPVVPGSAVTGIVEVSGGERSIESLEIASTAEAGADD